MVVMLSCQDERGSDEDKGCKRGNYLDKVDEDRKNWRNGGMDGLLWDSREFSGIVEWLSSGSLERHRDNGLSNLWSDTMMTVIDWSFETTPQKWFTNYLESKAHLSHDID
ncbi:hypothetical protein PVK06_007723 [Gossypium arboreum]|uniref:Uncharacterized protein n=1 Tax=Gossypium arboreum TaxID=29729 RepID=A0ABR0QJI0_GOSAR|nr:hypothetical protein PVK06_007723 [Gossypium arboreum]